MMQSLVIIVGDSHKGSLNNTRENPLTFVKNKHKRTLKHA
jgi:hypothetical protein